MNHRALKFLLAVLVPCGASCGRVQDEDHIASPVTQIANFGVALDAFHKDCGRFPSSGEGLAALISRPSGIKETQWHGSYLDSIPEDAWGHEFVYRCPGLHNTSGFDIYSRGPDGVSKSSGDDADDIANWPKRRPGP
jgi:general secretion pathway protein G